MKLGGSTAEMGASVHSTTINHILHRTGLHARLAMKNKADRQKLLRHEEEGAEIR